MKFIVIEIDDGGATKSQYYTAADVANYLGKTVHWEGAFRRFIRREWVVGEWMDYPCGWIFCVGDTDVTAGETAHD